MSLNITSDGSPTPRKVAARFAIAEDLRVETSPEGLGAVGTRRPVQYPTHYWPINSSLTSNMQGVKRPLTTTTRGNQLRSEQHLTLPDRTVNEAYKVRT